MVLAVKPGSEEDAVDSSEDELELEEEEPLIDKRLKKKKTTTVHASPLKFRRLPPHAVGRSQPTLTWVPGHYMPLQQRSHSPWTAGTTPALPDAWHDQNVAALPEDSDDRNARRKRKAEYDSGTRERAIAGRKPNQLFLLPGGEVDSTCEGKNAWDEALRDLVPKCLDMSVVAWANHDPKTLKKLRAALDNEFEYVGNPLSMVGFRVAITRFLKAERCRLKNRYLKGTDTPPLHVNKASWDRLKAYWNTDRQKEKAQKMSLARQSVRNLSCVGRRGKGARLHSAVSVHDPSSVTCCTCSSRNRAGMCMAQSMHHFLSSQCPVSEYYLYFVVTFVGRGKRKHPRHEK